MRDVFPSGLPLGPQSAASAEPRPTTLAEALLPMLLHSVNNTTQILMAISGTPGMFESIVADCGNDVARAAHDAHDQGWVLGVLGCELGADLLMARREERGLEPLVLLVRYIARRRGGELDGPEELPRLAPDVGSGWELPWALAWLLWSASEDAPDARASFEVHPPASGHPNWRITVRARCAECLRDATRQICARLPESSFDVRSDGVEWSLPAAWMRV